MAGVEDYKQNALRFSAEPERQSLYTLLGTHFAPSLPPPALGKEKPPASISPPVSPVPS